MLSPERLFVNHFMDETITGLRLANFSEDCLNRFIAQNTGGQFDAVISSLTVALSVLRRELGDVDISMGTQKAKTFAINGFMSRFKNTMSEEEDFIARRCGGIGSDGYKELYPNGVTEYWKANKTQMHLLVDRLYEATAKFSIQLGDEYTTLLQSFKTEWQTFRDNQEKEMGRVKNNRTERNGARRQLEQELMIAMFTVGIKFPGKVNKCMSFFNFRLLHGKKHHQQQTAVAEQ